MQQSPIHFVDNIARSLTDSSLQSALRQSQKHFVEARRQAVAQHEDFEQLRELGKQIRDHTIRHIDRYLARFEQAANARGTTVLWAKDAAEANAQVLDITHKHRCERVIKSKSMATEEIGLNDILTEKNIGVTETDLGEFIIQLAGEPPSHIIAPALHKSIGEVEELFRTHIDYRASNASIAGMTKHARDILRTHFLSADCGISGANFLVAETGSSVLVTNEGNGRMSSALPDVHITIAGIDKVIPSLRALAPLLALLTRSATGQITSNYLSLLTGSRRASKHAYVILLDNGRRALINSQFQDILRCIRCGACMNHCPVYQKIGGHSYGSTYPGPIGQVLTPLLFGRDDARHLPHAMTGCNACSVVCPVKIPLPDLMRLLQAEQVEGGKRPRLERVLMWFAIAIARRPRLYRGSMIALNRLLRYFGGEARVIRSLPAPFGIGSGWFRSRHLPAPAAKTFLETLES